MTIKLPGRFKLGLIATARGAVGMSHQVFFNHGDRPELVVSNGKMVAVIPVDVVKGSPPSETTRVTGSAWALATSGQGSKEDREITLSGNKVVVKDDAGRQIMSVSAGDAKPAGLPPSYRKVIPEPKSQHVAVMLDPNQLRTLSRVIGSPGHVVLHMDADPKNGIVKGPIRVTSMPFEGNEQPHGALMPITIEKDRRGKKLIIDTK
jgi:hypothetical protein